MLIDLLRYRAPQLRLLLALFLSIELVLEIQSRSKLAPAELPHEQITPTGFVLIDQVLGETVQAFLHSTTVFFLLLGIGSTVLRLHSCAFIKLPSDLPNAVFYYDKEERTARSPGSGGASG